MKYISDYNTSKIDDKKIQWVKIEPVKSSVESKRLKELIKISTDNLYDIFHTTEPYRKIVNTKPILKYSGSNIRGNMLLSHIKDSELYNRDEESKKSAYKKNWHELLGDKDYLPRTVTDKRQIKTLEFPIIAKPSIGHSGIGIMKFDTLEECMSEVNKDNCELDTFSEMIKDIDTEYRFIYVKDKLFLVHERIAIIEENKTITSKKTDESLKFLYIEQDLEKESYSGSDSILTDFRKHIDLDFYALDIMLDTHGKYWLIESNSGIGMGGNTLCRAYEAIYKDYYDKDELPIDKQEVVNSVCSEYYKEILKMYPEEMKLSKNPKTYE